MAAFPKVCATSTEDKVTPMSSICGGMHQWKEWTDKEIDKHLDKHFGSCIDCWCGIPFKMKKSATSAQCDFVYGKMSLGEKKIKEELEKQNIRYIYQYPILRSFGIKKFFRKNYKVEIEDVEFFFDFYLPELKTAIEFQGKQHWVKWERNKSKKKSWEPLEENEIKYDPAKEQIHRDRIKKEICERRNIKLIRIPYWHIDKISEHINNLCSQHLIKIYLNGVQS